MSKEFFEVKDLDIDCKKDLLERNLWDGSISVPLERLKEVSLTYYNFDGQIKNGGKLIIFDLLADYTIDIFQTLLARSFPIEKINLTSDYNGSDEFSMEDNNTSCFNCRKIFGTTTISLHSYGMAIDINPLQNPFLTKGRIFPQKGVEYLNRSVEFLGKVEPIVPFITKTPFTIWGGEWQEKDYHHFQLDRKLAEQLASLSFNQGKTLLINAGFNHF